MKMMLKLLPHKTYGLSRLSHQSCQKQGTNSKNTDEHPKPKCRSELKGEVRIRVMKSSGGSPEFSGPIRVMQRPALLRRSEVAAAEFAAAKKAGLEAILEEIAAAGKKDTSANEAVTAPPKEICTAQIPGIEVMDLEDAVHALWKEGIYAESGMGCTGPIVLMADDKRDRAYEILKNAGYVG